MKIGICILIQENDGYFQFLELLKNLEDNTAIDVNYYIYDNECKDKRISKYLLELDKNKYTVNISSKVSKAKALNYLLGVCKEKHICIVPFNYLLNNFWLVSLYHFYSTCPDAGVISIRNGFEKIFISPILFHDQNNQDVLKNVWVSNNGSIEGLLFFDKEKIITRFDENLEVKNCEEIDFTFNVFCQGYQNFYITGQNAIKLTFGKNKIDARTKEDLIVMEKKWQETIKKNIKQNEYN